MSPESEGLSPALLGDTELGCHIPFHSIPSRSPRSHHSPQICFPSPAGEGERQKGLKISSWSGRVRIKCSNQVSPSFTPSEAFCSGFRTATDTEGENQGKELFVGTPWQGISPLLGEVSP